MAVVRGATCGGRMRRVKTERQKGRSHKGKG